MKRKAFWNLRRRDAAKGYAFCLPWLLGFLIFFLYPMAYSLVLSFTQTTNSVAMTLKFIGWENYIEAFITDVNFLPYLGESLRDVLINTPIIVAFSLFIAVLLNRKLKLRGVYRAAFLMPIILGAGAVMKALQGSSSYMSLGGNVSMSSLTESTVSVQDLSLNNRLLFLLGPTFGEYVQLGLNQISNALWQSGIQIIIFLGALQSIPESYYEAAHCDGASGWEKLWKITLPIMMPNILLASVYTVIDSMASANNKLITYTVNTFYAKGMPNFASAMGWMYFLCIAVVLLIVFFLFRKSFEMQ